MQPCRSNRRVTSSKSINGDGQDDGVPDFESIEERGNIVKEEVLDLSIPSSENGKEKEEMRIGEQLALEIVQWWELPSDEKMNKPNEEKREHLMWEIWEHFDEVLINRHIRDNADLDQQNDPMMQPREPPSDFIMPLLRYQKEWLAWALEQEESFMKGGILADEMGMGKTVQAIALVLAEREICRKKYEADAPGPSTGSPAVKATLIVCPVAAVSQWLSEIIRFTAEGSTKALAYHGPNRGKITEQFLNYDFVITTYSTMETEYRKYMMTQPKTNKKRQPIKPILHSVKWNRIILDEAHFVKDKNTSTAKAVFSLESLYRWALSGTPLQNRVGELYSLVRFLQITPFSYYLCSDCNCKILDNSGWKCASCGHFEHTHFSWWNKNIYEPVQGFRRNRAMTLLIHGVLKKIALRRTKKGRAADLALPPKNVKLRRDTLDVKEADYYEALRNETNAQFETYLRAGTIKSNHTPISDLVMGMRKAVNHPYLVEYSKKADERNGSVETDEQDNVNIKNIKGFKASSILNRLQLDKFQTSTKIEALREEISFMIERDNSAKGIVFSQFNSFLDLINFSLQQSGINCVQLDGSMSIQARDGAMKRFNEDVDCKIFLMSYKTGSVALNLTVASHVFLMDPWWNPALERQAVDRVHRIGQHKPIRVVRFIIENSIEEKILDMQKKKELLFEGTVGGSVEALGKLDVRDIASLFFDREP